VKLQLQLIAMPVICTTSYIHLIPKYKSELGDVREFVNEALSQYFLTLPRFEDIEDFNKILEQVEFSKTNDEEATVKYLLFKFKYYWGTTNVERAKACLNKITIITEPLCRVIYLRSRATVCHHYLEFEQAIKLSKWH